MSAVAPVEILPLDNGLSLEQIAVSLAVGEEVFRRLALPRPGATIAAERDGVAKPIAWVSALSTAPGCRATGIAGFTIRSHSQGVAVAAERNGTLQGLLRVPSRGDQ